MARREGIFENLQRLMEARVSVVDKGRTETMIFYLLTNPDFFGGIFCNTFKQVFTVEDGGSMLLTLKAGCCGCLVRRTVLSVLVGTGFSLYDHCAIFSVLSYNLVSDFSTVDYIEGIYPITESCFRHHSPFPVTSYRLT